MKTASPDVNFPALERRIIDYWRSEKIFKRSLEMRRDAPQYMFYDGPPFATGTPHYGHLLAGTIKDIIPRYQSMRGFYVERRFGWDTHGLPIEMIAEKELNLKGRSDIVEYGIGKFNDACKAGVLKYVKEWEIVTERLGRWIDFVNDYKTMDLDFMDSVWWVFKQLWDNDRVYLGKRVMPYSWRLATPLSNFEASSNYKETQDPAVTIRFRLIDQENCSLLAWTTTPWTLVSNMALCVNKEVDYIEIKLTNGERFILGEQCLANYFKDSKQYEILRRLKGSDLVGTRYQPLFEYFSTLGKQGAFQVLEDDYVTTADGTGIVHLTCHGEDDFRVLSAKNIPWVDAIDREGNFDAQVPKFQGLNIKDAEKEIIKALKDSGALFKHETITHSYPFCERSDTPLIYKVLSAWYVKVEDIRDQMLANNAKIQWVPEHIKDGRFGKWLESARDWNVSRNRFWGNPLPIWICDKCGHQQCLGSKAELEKLSGQKVNDLHKQYVDELSWKCEQKIGAAACSGTMLRTPEVLDCWFESGSMPYAQLHYPFENKERFEAAFPADFIAEGLDQTRGWFYTLMVLSTSLFKKEPFKNVVVNGIILAEDGKKMSKRLKNYPDPTEVMELHGADALRLFMINSPAVRGESLRFSEAGVKEIVRSVLLPFWNVYSFFTTYACVDGFKPSLSSDLRSKSNNALDRWIISRFQSLLSKIEAEMAQYHLYAVVPVLLEFIEELTNWYVRRSRRRFWSDDTNDKQAGYETLYYVLSGFSRALAPFLPFVTEEIFLNLRALNSELPESVHLTEYPRPDQTKIDLKLESEMALIKSTVGLGRSLRARLDLKVRQPLASITVITRNESDRGALAEYEQHIKDELNVKSVLFSTQEEQFVELSIKPNFPVLGKIFGKEMGAVGSVLKGFGFKEAYELEAGSSVDVLGRQIVIEQVQVIRQPKANLHVESSKGVSVLFDTQITPDLRSEGLAREFVNRVQRMRKDGDFKVTDRIEVSYVADSSVQQALEQHVAYIRDETLCLTLTALGAQIDSATTKAEVVQEHDLDGKIVRISVQRA